MAVFNKTIITLTLVGYDEMIIASLAIYRLISNARSWNNCKENVKPILGAHAINLCIGKTLRFFTIVFKPLMRIVASSDDKAQ